MKNKKSISSQILLIIIVLVLINVLSDKFFVRLDFTADQRYTLSKATKDILRSLPEPVTITAYFTEDLPQGIAKSKRDFKELLVEYATISKGKVVYEFIDPNQDKAVEQQAIQSGIRPVVINVREKDQVKQQKVFLGVKIQMGENTETIPLIQPGTAMEYALSSAIKKIAIEDKPLIGFLQGQGEPSLASFRQVLAQLSVLYNVEPVTISDTIDNLSKFKTITIISPADTFSDAHFSQIDNYLSNGGNLFIAMNRVNADMQTSQGVSLETGLEKWLANKGLLVEENFVVDGNCGTVGVRQQAGMFNFTQQVKFPYMPIITNFEDHPITKGLEQVVMPFVSSITYVGDTSLNFIPIAKSSKKSGTQSLPVYFDINKKWKNTDLPLSNITVAAILSGKISGDKLSKIILVADGDFPVNGEGQQAQQLQPDNVNLMVNSIDWLSDATGLINLRTKGVTSRPLDQIEGGTKAMLKWGNFLLPIFIVIIYGIIRMQRRKKLRIKRMEENYV